MEERNFVPKGWGYEDWIVNKEEYCGKLLFFKKGKRCSWHYHKLKDETFYIYKGELEVRDVEMFEFSTQHFDEDSIRIEVGSQ